ncbi:ATP-binding cassette domain-containing protein [Clostridium cylindrosporum]|uniref:ABC-type polar amino acid transport system, ATPase component n=1 Tax=Clostridium cylindrosporum DSM 605 TaxID=1121307 RepID=A0A0J8DGH6_CLOCY|nr:ATP-binding cassette domain-containing protein [Clostridium cylindrosporum]KMT23329.1 ABC-type polar amino acid transport system, ATPase component [Clostridium cylindrosporum DSM 605]
MIELRGVGKTYDDNEVLKDISFKANKGEIAVLLGTSGSGKSTLLKGITFIESPTKGEVIINGKLISFEGISEEELLYIKKNIEIVFCEYNILEDKTALENVLENLITIKGWGRLDAMEKALFYLDKVGLRGKINHYPHELSNLQKLKIEIAKALAKDPKIILLDGITNNLDSESVEDIMQVLKEVVSENIAIIIATHEVGFAKEVSDKVLLIDNGRVVLEGSFNDVFENATDERIKEFLKEIV